MKQGAGTEEECRHAGLFGSSQTFVGAVKGLKKQSFLLDDIKENFFCAGLQEEWSFMASIASCAPGGADEADTPDQAPLPDLIQSMMLVRIRFIPECIAQDAQRRALLHLGSPPNGDTITKQHGIK